MQSQFVYPAEDHLINPASIDIRIGKELIEEDGFGTSTKKVNLEKYTERMPYLLQPRQFVLIGTYERLMVPNGYAMELKLKSSIARKGFQHSLAFWFDSGWNGIGTMEVSNITQHTNLSLWYGMRFAQIIYHTLDQLAEKPYSGRYQNANSVEGPKLYLDSRLNA